MVHTLNQLMQVMRLELEDIQKSTSHLESEDNSFTQGRNARRALGHIDVLTHRLMETRVMLLEVTNRVDQHQDGLLADVFGREEGGDRG